MWKCKICGCDNTESNATCRMCKASAPGEGLVPASTAGTDLWKCKICGCENPKQSTACRICKAAAPGEVFAPASTSGNNMWKCKICGCENPNSYTICRICKTPTPGKESVLTSDTGADIWKCKICGCVNPNSSAICRMCKALSPEKSRISDVSDGSKRGKRPSPNRLRNGLLVASSLVAVIIVGVFTVMLKNVRTEAQVEQYDFGMCTPVEANEIVSDRYGGEIVGDRLIVLLNEGVENSEADRIASKYNATISGYIKDSGIIQIRFKEFPTLDELGEAVKAVESDPAVLYAMYDSIQVTAMVPDDPWIATGESGKETWTEENPEGNNWGLEAIHMPSAWQIAGETEKVNVGVLDMGFYIEHEDLVENVSSESSNHVQGLRTRKNFQKNNIHGTHVSGIIGAKYNNRIGISGIAPNCELELRCTTGLFDSLFGTKYSIKKMDSTIINISFAEISIKARLFPDLQVEKYRAVYSRLLKNIISKKDILIIAAAGNDGDDAKWSQPFATINDPELRRHIIVVGNMKRGNTLDEYLPNEKSCYGDTVDIFAPGTDILSTEMDEDGNSIYKRETGTSVAAPHVTGVAALIKSINPDLGGTEIKEIIMSGSTNTLTYHGKEYPILDARPAVEMAISSQNGDEDKSQQDDELTQTTLKTPQTGSPVNIEEKSIYYDNEYVSVQISYPEISGLLDKELEKEINTVVMQEMYNDIDSSEQVAVEENSDYLYSVEASYEVGRNDGAFLSMYLNVYCESGGAHGEEYTLYYNVLNTNPGVILSLSDLFIEGSDYISVLNEKIRELIEKDSNLSQENYFTTITKNQDFYLTDSELVVTFQKGDIAAYIEDQPVFRVPLNEISGLVVPWLK